MIAEISVYMLYYIFLFPAVKRKVQKEKLEKDVAHPDS